MQVNPQLMICMWMLNFKHQKVPINTIVKLL